MGNAENMAVKKFKTRELDQGNIPNRLNTLPLNVVFTNTLSPLHHKFIAVFIIDTKFNRYLV